MRYKELAELDSTPEQDEALAIEWAVIHAAHAAPETPGALLAQWVKERLLDDVVAQRIHQPREQQILHAFRESIARGDHAKLKAMTEAAALNAGGVANQPNASVEEPKMKPGLLTRVRGMFGV